MSLSRSARSEHAVTPGGCRWCGIEARGHGRQWLAEVGWHAWVAPTAEQLKERLQRRRAQSGQVRKPGSGSR
jgi:hypothetical protein